MLWLAELGLTWTRKVGHGYPPRSVWVALDNWRLLAFRVYSPSHPTVHVACTVCRAVAPRYPLASKSYLTLRLAKGDVSFGLKQERTQESEEKSKP